VESKNGLCEEPQNVWASVKMHLTDKQVVLGNHAYTPRYLMEKMVSRVLEVGAAAIDDEAFVEMKPKILVAGIPIRFTAGEKGEMLNILEKCSNTKVLLVHEPVLAAIYNDSFIKHKNGSSLKENRKVLVIDAGGGTTDIVVLTTNPHPNNENPEPYIPHHPAGFRIAGDDIDRITEELILEKVRQNPGNIKMDILENTAHYDRRRLRQTARAVKEKLSSVETYSFEVNGEECGSTTIKITRAEFENRIESMLKELVDGAYKTLCKCNLDKDPDVDILLVGGTTNIPLFKRLVTKKFNWISDERIYQRNAAMAIALGAAIYAQNPKIVSSKVAYGYGVNTHINDGAKEVLRVMIPSVTRLPFTISANFSTLDDLQTAASFRVYEVYDIDENTTYIDMDRGKMTSYCITHDFKSPVQKNTPIRLTITLTEDGVLNAMVEDFLSQKHVYRETFTLNGTRSN
ncbi:MAG: Hsp70 family protein, partial [Clostridia bacterium]|nr:Hsp70 family protein [Clostridia bacterium]